MKRPDKILDIFKTLSDEAARDVAELRQRRDDTLKAQVGVLRSIEDGWNVARRDRSLSVSAAGYSKSALKEAAALRRRAEGIAHQEVHARDVLLDRFADQKRFELYLSQRQLKERAVARKREEKTLLEQIDQLGQARTREDNK